MSVWVTNTVRRSFWYCFNAPEFTIIADTPIANTANNTSLDGVPGRRGYAVFGWIISGRPVLDAINIVPVYRYSDTDIQPRTEILVYWAQRIQ